MNSIPQPGEVWQHSKTKGEYEIMSTGQLQVKTEALDMKDCIIYKSLSDGKVWIRPIEDFIEEIKTEESAIIHRFTKIN